MKELPYTIERGGPRPIECMTGERRGEGTGMARGSEGWMDRLHEYIHYNDRAEGLDM